MASFEIIDHEGQRFVRIRIQDETVRAESGALSHMMGDIRITARLPSLTGAIKAAISGEAAVRPAYTGTGEIFFGPPIFGEYQTLELHNEEWILEQGAYVCSDMSIEVGVWRNKALAAFFGGEGWFQTSVKGTGTVIMQAPGYVQRVELTGERLSVDGRFAGGTDQGAQLLAQFVRSGFDIGNQADDPEHDDENRRERERGVVGERCRLAAAMLLAPGRGHGLDQVQPASNPGIQVVSG